MTTPAKRAVSIPKITPTRIRKKLLPYLLVIPALTLLLAGIGYPLARIFWMGFFEVEPLRHPEPIFLGLANYLRLFRDFDLWKTFLQTGYWTFPSVALQFILGLVAALILNEQFRGRGIARTLLILPWIMPAVIGAFSWRWIYHDQLGALNFALRSLGIIDRNINWLGNLTTALPAAVLVNVWRGFPFMMTTLLAGMQSIPQELLDAAAVDGASAWQRIRYITLPSLRPVIFAITLLASIWTFNNFSYIYILTGGGPAGRTDILVTYAYKQSFGYWHFGYASAISVALFLIVFGLGVLYLHFMQAEG